MRKRIVARAVPRTRRPDQLARQLVERVNPIAPWSLSAPVRGDATRDYQVLIDDRRTRATVWKREPPKFFHHRMPPQRTPFRAERGQNPLRPLHVNIAGFRIDCRAGGRVAQVDRVAQVIVVATL